jgi:endonuclease/exonuclease/phosphatase family metal-dependent hydrolase
MRTARAVVSILLADGAAALLAAWTVGRLLTDRFHWSQYLYWLPTALVAAAAAVVVLLSAAVAPRARPRPGGRLRILAGLGLIAAALHLAAFEWRLLRPRPHTTAQPFTVISWNASLVDEEDISRTLLQRLPDLAAVVNAPWGANFEDLERAGQWPTIIHEGAFLVASRFPVRRWGRLDLGIQSEEGGKPDPGRAMFAELERTDAPPLILWIIDLPSDPRLARTTITRLAAKRIDEWTGPEYVRDGRGWRPTLRGTRPFPAPDLILGDFNIPRASASLQALTRGLTDAFDQAGHADPSTWPRVSPWWAIDHAFVGPALRATDYLIRDPGKGQHRFVELRLEP